METALHRELHQREQELRNESKRIVKEADKIEDLNQKPISDTDAQSVKGGMAMDGVKIAKK